MRHFARVCLTGLLHDGNSHEPCGRDIARYVGNLAPHLIDAISEVREITDDWLGRYNEIRPHDALGSLPPARYRERLLAAEIPL